MQHGPDNVLICVCVLPYGPGHRVGGFEVLRGVELACDACQRRPRASETERVEQIAAPNLPSIPQADPLKGSTDQLSLPTSRYDSSMPQHEA